MPTRLFVLCSLLVLASLAVRAEALTHQALLRMTCTHERIFVVRDMSTGEGAHACTINPAAKAGFKRDAYSHA